MASSCCWPGLKMAGAEPLASAAAAPALLEATGCFGRDVPGPSVRAEANMVLMSFSPLQPASRQGPCLMWSGRTRRPWRSVASQRQVLQSLRELTYLF